MHARALTRIPALRTLLVFILVLILYLVYGHTHFYRDPLSIFWSPEHGYDRRYSRIRQREARDFLESHGVPSEGEAPQLQNSWILDSKYRGNITKASTTPKICASFSTVRRKGQQYVEEAIGSAVAGLSPEERREMYLQVFFASTDSEAHPTYDVPWLRELVDNVSSYEALAADDLEQAQKLEARRDWRAKSLFDYTKTLQRCYEVGTPFVLMLEGDILMADGWLARLLKGIRLAREDLKMDTSEWLYMRLFNQERSTGWRSTKVGGNHEFAISLGIGLAVWCAALAVRRAAPVAARNAGFLDNGSLTVVCLLAVPTCVVLVYQSGKASLFPPRPGVFKENFGCCSQALLYPREQIPGLTRSLTHQGTDHYDLMINRYAKDAALARLALYPVSVQHVGRESVRGTNQLESIATWSAAFEDLDPETLRREHMAMLAELFGTT